jgi:hypothetical protein
MVAPQSGCPRPGHCSPKDRLHEHHFRVFGFPITRNRRFGRPAAESGAARSAADATPAPHGSSRVPDAPDGAVDICAVRDHRPVTQASARLTRRVRRDFPPGLADTVLGQLTGVPETLPLCSQDAERMQASIVITAHGDYERFLAALQRHGTTGETLVGSGLGDDDWRERLTDAVGPP